jgi:hypothetical protein
MATEDSLSRPRGETIDLETTEECIVCRRPEREPGWTVVKPGIIAFDSGLEINIELLGAAGESLPT